jgi:hypothetical protein
MNPTRILPDLQCSLLVEDVRQEANGNMFLIGVLNVIRVPHVPITAARLLFFNRWTAGVGRFKETMRLIAPDQNTVMGKVDLNFELPDVSLHAMNLAVFGNVTFTAPGVYYAEVLVDDVMKIRYPINVVVVPPPQPPGAPPPPQKPAS